MLLIAALISLYLSYNATRGLPFLPSYQVNADVPDAAELNAGTSEVRVGGSRVGIVKEVEAMPGRRGRPAYARLRLSLDPRIGPLPADSTVAVRPRSILGAKYLDVNVGRSARGIAAGGSLAIGRARPTVEFDEAFGAFDRNTSAGMRGSLQSLGDGFAGRGTAVNGAIADVARMLPRARRVARALAAPGTELEGLIQGAARTTRALAAVSPQLGTLVDHGTTTLAALDAARPALDRTLVELPPAEASGTRALTRLTPVLDDSIALVHGLRPGTRAVPRAARALADAVDRGTPLLSALNAPFPARDRTGRTTVRIELGRTFDGLRELSRDPATPASVRGLTVAVESLRPTLDVLVPAQTVCNVLGLWTRNVGDVLLSGDASGNWLNVLPVFDAAGGLMLQSPRPDPRIHINHHPILDRRECEAGNEPYAPGQRIGNPPGRQPARTERTAPIPGTRERARDAGLLPGQEEIR